MVHVSDDKSNDFSNKNSDEQQIDIFKTFSFIKTSGNIKNIQLTFPIVFQMQKRYVLNDFRIINTL